MDKTGLLSTVYRNSLRLVPVLSLAVGGLFIGTVAATAQIKPASSGEPSFREPEMKPHGEGLYHPNERRHGHHRRLRPARPARE